MAEVRPAVICVEPLGFYIVSKTCNKKKYAKLTPDEREKKEKEEAEINAADKRTLFERLWSAFRFGFWYVATSSGFEHFITFVIVLNTLAMCMEFYGAPDTYMYVLAVANQVFLVVFTIEAVIKLLGLGTKYYF
jgi:hypothetical protein